MNKLRNAQGGFIPMLIMLLLLIIGGIALAYWRVSTAAN